MTRGKFAILFSGQGAQATGMGLDLLEDPLFAETIAKACEASKLDLVAAFRNEHGELDQTRYVQPALVAFEAGIWQMLMRDTDLDVAGMLGLSLGEYGAVIASGALDLETGIALTSDRACYMQADCEKAASSMVALVKPKLDELKELLGDLESAGKQVYFCNFNSPKQVVIGGTKDDLAQALDLIKEQGLAKRAVDLDVAGAFHTPLFLESAKKMQDRLRGVAFNQPQYPVYSNTIIQPFTAGNLAETLVVQLMKPTNYGDCLAKMQAETGFTQTLEIGPGKTLSSFAKSLDRSLGKFYIGSMADYQDFLESYQNGFEG